MLENWLSPIKLSKCLKSELGIDDFGHHLHIHTIKNGMPDLSEVKLAIIGLEAKSADPVRQHWYHLAYNFPNLKIADLGNLRKQTIEFSISALSEIRASGILPILIGQAPQHMQALYRALKLNYESINIAVIDEQAPLNPRNEADSKAYLNPLILPKTSHVFQVGLIGSQIHFIPNSVHQFIKDQNYDLVRLGDAKASLEEVEPIIRNADLAGINLNALRSGDFIAVPQPCPSGFSVEEICKLAHYAGMSDKLKGFYILGYDPTLDQRSQAAFVMAEVLWYFIDGFYNRKGDYPISTEGLTEYIVELKQYDYPLTFWKSKWTNRWWIQVPAKVRKRDYRHRLIPCSYSDYKLACQDELPERLISAFKRFV